MLINNLKTLLLLPLLFAIQNTLAQTNTHLILSNQYPAPGESISFTYNPEGTMLADAKHISAIVFFLGNSNKNFPIDINLKPERNLLKGSFLAPPIENAFLIKISSGELVDNNEGNGYIYMFYKDKQPVAGAYASEAAAASFGTLGQTKIKIDRKAGIALFKKEFELYPKSEKTYRFNYYPTLIFANEYREVVNQKIYSLEQSNEEEDLSMAVYLLSLSGNRKKADSLNDVIRTKFPNGRWLRMDLESAFTRENYIYKKESLYRDFFQRYPANTDEEKATLEYFKTQLANAYLLSGDLANFYKWEDEIIHKTGIAAWINLAASQWAKNSLHLEIAEKVCKLSLDIIAERVNAPRADVYISLSMAKEEAQKTYDSYADTYALILLKENKFAEALKYEQPVFDHSETKNTDVEEHYIQILSGLGKYAEAKAAAENYLKAGLSTEAIKEELRNSYDHIKGSDEGYDQYLALLENPPKDVALRELSGNMLKQPSPHFSLIDIFGKTVSLAELKGKIVIIDFGETFCGHCKISFNRMQLAVEKFNDDPNVKFLFVDTENSSKDFFAGIQKYIADNHYNFDVCTEEKSGLSNIFGVTGLSATFIVDKSGNIRFKYIDFDGKPERLRDELANMIELAAKDN